MSIYPQALKPVFEKLKRNNIRAVIVGGFVRDYLLNMRNSRDIDIELYNVSSLKDAETILSEFGKVCNVGKSFGVCKLNFSGYSLDFSLPRTDNKISKGHKGFEVTTYKNIDFKTAASRRDFRVNAIGYDVVHEKFLDPFNGINDLENKILRFVDAQTFSEDSLRVLRAVSFHSRYNFEIDEKLFLICKNMVENSMLDELPKERIYEEIKKILLKSPIPSKGFKLLKSLGALTYFPYQKRILDALDVIAKHNITNIKTKETVMLATICYSFKKEALETFLSKLTNSKKLQNNICNITSSLKNIIKLSKDSFCDYDIYKLSTQTNIYESVLVCNALFHTGDKVLQKARELNVEHTRPLALVNGKELIKIGLKPSKEFSKIIDKAYEAQLKGVFKSYNEALTWLKTNYTPPTYK